MATYYGNQYANLVAVPQTKMDPADANGAVKILYFDYTITSTTPATTDIIKLGVIPRHARIIDVEISAPDLGTTGALNVGWAASADLTSAGVAVEAANASGFFAALDVNTAAATQNMSDVSGASVAGYLKKFAAACDFQIAPSTVWTVTSGTIKGFVKYSLP